MYYIHKDHLGSFQTITNNLGSVVQELSYDPWGRARNPIDWTYSSSPYTNLFDRGYTGHEHMSAFSLINMNGRLYDPWLGRMLSRDPIVQYPGYSQNYNRYSYTFNNPLKYTDPSGYQAETYLEHMRDTYDSEGMGFNYRGQYFAYSTESGSYTGASGGVIAGPNPYTYNWSNGKYYDSKGNEVSYFEVHNNFVLPNATPIKEKYGHWVGKTRIISTTEFNGEGIQPCPPTTIETIQWWIPYGSDGGGGLPGLSTGTERGIGLGGSLWGGAATVTYADEIANGVSLTSKGMTYLRVGGNTLGGLGFAATSYNNVVKIQNGTFNTADAVDWGVSGGMLLTGVLISNPVGLTVLAVGGIGYGIYRLAAGDATDAWINENFGFRP